MVSVDSEPGQRMNDNSPIIQFLLLGLFEIVGGAVLAATLRQIIGARGKGCLRQMNMVIFGAVFGLAPLLFGAQHGARFLGAQIALLVAVIALVLIFWNTIQEIAGNRQIVVMIIGGLFIVIGLGLAGFQLRQGQLGQAALFLLLFGGMGGLAFGLGLRDLLSSKE